MQWYMYLVQWYSCDCKAAPLQLNKYSEMPLWRGPIYHDITYSTAITVAESKSDFLTPTDTPYLSLMGELWGVYDEDFEENRLHYSGTTLYSYCHSLMNISANTDVLLLVPHIIVHFTLCKKLFVQSQVMNLCDSFHERFKWIVRHNKGQRGTSCVDVTNGMADNRWLWLLVKIILTNSIACFRWLWPMRASYTSGVAIHTCCALQRKASVVGPVLANRGLLLSSHTTWCQTSSTPPCWKLLLDRWVGPREYDIGYWKCSRVTSSVISSTWIFLNPRYDTKCECTICNLENHSACTHFL